MCMNLDIEEIKHAEKSQKMYQEFLIYVEHENVEFDRNESKNLELQLKEKINWFERYLKHLEEGGKRIKAGADYWAQHENHYLTIEYGEDEQGDIEQDILFIWCETCSDIVSSHAHEKSKIKIINEGVDLRKFSFLNSFLFVLYLNINLKYF